MANQADGLSLNQSTEGDMNVAERYKAVVSEGETVSLSKYVSVVTSRDIEEENQIDEAQSILEKAMKDGYSVLKKAHVNKWAERWNNADVVIDGDEASQQGIRFNIFQLFSTYYGEDPRLNVGPKGFTGEKYGGATYWDTESCILPMYLSITDEEVSEQLLV